MPSQAESQLTGIPGKKGCKATNSTDQNFILYNYVYYIKLYTYK